MTPKQLFQKLVPHPSKIIEHPSLQFMGHRLKDPNLWHMNRRSVANGMFIGLFCAFLPAPGQIALATFMAILMRGNLPTAICATWVSNPITYAPIFYFTYKVGTLLITSNADVTGFDFSIDTITTNIEAIWKPLFLGSFLCGLAVASIGYVAIRVYWRMKVLHIWRKRKRKKKKLEQAKLNADTKEM